MERSHRMKRLLTALFAIVAIAGIAITMISIEEDH